MKKLKKFPWLLVFILCFSFCFALTSFFKKAKASPLFTTKYDHLIKESSKIYMPEVDWKYWKAQLGAESGFREDIITGKQVSSVGAMGIAQLMPATWNEVAKQMSWGGEASPKIAEFGILAGAFYMKRLTKGWGKCFNKLGCRTNKERHFLAVASYNAGLGNLYKAQKKAGGSIRFKIILSNLPKVTGKYSKETIGYVNRIKRYYKILKLE